MKKGFVVFSILMPLLFCTCRKEKDIPIVPDFAYSIETESHLEHHASAVTFTNHSTGAYRYKWTFEGGNPETSEKENPGTVTYAQSGQYQVTLEAWNTYGGYNSKTITLDLDTTLFVDFELTALIDHSAPLTVELTNRCHGAVSYLWTFENGIPAQSVEKTPQGVVFPIQGTYKITLTASDGKQEKSVQKNITVTPPLTIDFDMIIPFNDPELPLTATLRNRSTHYHTLLWSTDNNAHIVNIHGETTPVTFSASGLTHITLTAMSLKDTLVLTKTITVLPDKNLLTFTNVSLGIVTAANTISPYFSTSLRRAVTPAEAQQSAGNQIDIAYWGHSRLFTINKFLSPDSVTFTILPTINNPIKCYIINNLAAAGINFTESNFQNITTGVDLESYTIRNNSSGQFFSLSTVPCYVLFETADGRKGAIKIKQSIDNGVNSYIIVDIKVQKHN